MLSLKRITCLHISRHPSLSRRTTIISFKEETVGCEGWKEAMHVYSIRCSLSVVINSVYEAILRLVEAGNRSLPSSTHDRGLYVASAAEGLQITNYQHQSTTVNLPPLAPNPARAAARLPILSVHRASTAIDDDEQSSRRSGALYALSYKHSRHRSGGAWTKGRVDR
jgi:hypothetical protein